MKAISPVCETTKSRQEMYAASNYSAVNSVRLVVDVPKVNGVATTPFSMGFIAPANIMRSAERFAWMAHRRCT
ncbi:hypothetical protein ANO14919_118990 [Xylariales sp. No.14919]|nr:hypothetical protein ANO14919_118990 [Xylariales sp. No.14919]